MLTDCIFSHVYPCFLFRNNIYAMNNLPYLSIFSSIVKHVRIASNACYCFFNIRSTMISKHSELVKRQARDRYGRFAFPSTHTAPPPSLFRFKS
jgi:hypothetical protein